MEGGNSNNTLEKLAGRLSNIVLLGFFTILFSLPVVTAGAAFTALNSSTKAYLYEEEDKPLRMFLSCFKKDFRTSTLIWLIDLAAIAILIWDFVYYRTGTSAIDILASAGIFVLMMFLALELATVFVIRSEKLNDTVFGSIKAAIDLSLSDIWRCLAVIVLVVASFTVAFFLFRGIFLFLPGIIAFLGWQLYPEMLKQYKRKTKALNKGQSKSL